MTADIVLNYLEIEEVFGMDEHANEPGEQSGQKSGRRIMPVIIVVVVVVVGALIVNAFLNSPKAKVSSDCTKITAQAYTIVYDGSNFSPACVTVPKGTKLTWDNKSSSELQVGTDPHPIHSGDRAISNGEFVFKVEAKSANSEVIDKVGTYGYHDHLNAGATGTLKVE
jgi:plastocyanin